MANDVVFTVEGKGKNLKKTANEAGDIGKNVDKSNAALDKAGKKQDSYNRREKGIFQTNLSSGKAYSKLAQNIGGGGSSSLVAAYATLAANVFALTAAFNALRNASQFEQLVQGLNAVGDAAGRNLTHLGEKLQEVTGHAISAERAMRAVAIGTSAGFSAEQLEKLTTVARGASIALGRDMGDAMDRLIRGAAKLEPEILDELGIMVRLDDATSDYAATINKTAGQLTQFERRMAFVTAINEQGLEKFEGIAKAVDPTPYDQLAASLDNLMKTGLGLVNTFLTPMINLMANSTGVLVGTITLFASTISRQMLPFLHDTADSARRAAEEFAKMNTVSRDNIVTTGALPPKYKKLSKSIVDGTASMEEMQVVQKELANSEKHRAGQLRNLDKAQDPEKYAKVKAGLDNVRKAQTELTRVTEGHLGVLARTKAADAMTMTSLSEMPKGWAKLNEAIGDNNDQIDLNVEKQGREIRTRDKASKAAFKYGQRIKFVGASLVRAVPFIGLAITAVGLLSAAWDHFFPGNKMNKFLTEVEDAFSRIDEITIALVKGTSLASDQVTILANQYRALAGVIATARDAISSLGANLMKAQMEGTERIFESIVAKQTEINRLRESGPEWGMTDAGHEARIKNIGYQLQQVQKRANDILKNVGKIDENNLAVIKQAVSLSIAKLEMFSKANNDIGRGELMSLKNILARIGKEGGIETIAQLTKEMTDAAIPTNKFQAAVDGAAQSMGNFLKATTKMGQVATTQFDEPLKALQAIRTEMGAIEDKAKQAGEETRERLSKVYGPKDSRVEMMAAITEAQERDKLFKVLSKQYNLEQTLGVKTREQFNEYVDEIEKSVKLLREQAGVIKRLKQLEKDTASFAKSQFIGRQLAVKEEFKATRARINAEIEFNKESIKTNNGLLLRGKLARFEELSAKKQAELTTTEADELKDLTELVKANAKLEADIIALKDEKLKLDLESKAVAVAKAEDDLAALKITEKMVGLERQRINLLKTQESNQAKLAAMRDPVRRGQGRETLSPAEEFKLFMQREARERKMLDREHRIKIAMLKAEDTLLKAKVELNKMEAQILRDRKLLSAKTDEEKEAAKEQYKAFVQSADDYVKAMSPLLQMRIDVANLENKVAHSNLSLEKERLGIAARRGSMSAFESASGDVRQGGGTGIAMVDAAAGLAAHNRERRIAMDAVRKEAIDKQNKQFDQSRRPAGETPEERAAKREQFGTIAGDAAVAEFKGADTMTEKVTLLRTATAGLNEELRKMGPEGEVAAAVGEGGMVMASGVAHIADTFKDTESKLERGAAVASAIASTIAATAQIMAAASAARIAAIDKEIAAEQRRDGKSKQSLSKIKAMEAKKAQMQKKAFEMNKKMQMASIVASTAAAMMSALVSATMYEKPLGFILAGIIGAMGAAQLAMVAGLQYQGGSGGISAPGAPTSINIGERSNKVDIAGGRGNAAGEMSYLRGDRGFGTSARDFRPAFAGRKYRAAGGAAYVVGEQGPELFVPSVPGRVVSNDDMEAGAAVGNVNFTINAIDAAGVEEVLVEQRGNIIGMLRESANEYGTGFLEEVNEDAYTSTTEGSVYGRA